MMFNREYKSAITIQVFYQKEIVAFQWDLLYNYYDILFYPSP